MLIEAHQPPTPTRPPVLPPSSLVDASVHSSQSQKRQPSPNLAPPRRETYPQDQSKTIAVSFRRHNLQQRRSPRILINAVTSNAVVPAIGNVHTSAIGCQLTARRRICLTINTRWQAAERLLAAQCAGCLIDFENSQTVTRFITDISPSTCGMQHDVSRVLAGRSRDKCRLVRRQFSRLLIQAKLIDPVGPGM